MLCRLGRAGAGLVLAALCAAAAAQPSTETDGALGLAQAVEVALQAHPDLRAADHQAAAAQAGVRAAAARANPEIVVAPTLLGEQGTPEAVSIAQPLELNGARQARVRAASAGALAATAERERVARDLALRVRTAYWDTVLAQACVELERQNLAHARTLVEAAALQVNLGNQPRMHQMKAEVELARGQQQLLAAQEQATLAMASLCAATGQAPGTFYRLTDSLEFAPAAFDEAQLLTAALASRPEVRLAQAGIDAADGAVEQMRVARKPDVAFTYWQETFDGIGGLGLSVSLPMLDWGGQKEHASQARSLREANLQQLAGVQGAIRLEVFQAATAVRGAEAQIQELRERVLDQSARLAELAATGYREGALPFMDVLEARRTLREVLLGYDAAVASHLKARVALEWASGGEILGGQVLPSPAARRVSAQPVAPTAAARAPAPRSAPGDGTVGVSTVRRLTAPGAGSPQARAEGVVTRP